MMVYEDYATNNVYRFLTNNLTIGSLTVSEPYKERGSVEFCFRWIIQHLHIKKFYGTTKNAVYLLLWIAACNYLLLIIAKKHFNIPQTLHTISKSIGPLLFKQDDINSIVKITKELIVRSLNIYRGLPLLRFYPTICDLHYSISLFINNLATNKSKIPSISIESLSFII